MGWEGLAPDRLCVNLKNPEMNGGRSGIDVINHLDTHLVQWAWSPGRDLSGRPRSTPPISHTAFVAAAKSWVQGGMPCPEAGGAL
jgi:hypothetical protein